MASIKNAKAVKPIEIHNEEPLEQVAGGKRLLSFDECHYYIAKECDGCGDCADACPCYAIRMQDYRAVIDPFMCGECGTCATLCHTGAVHER